MRIFGRAQRLADLAPFLRERRIALGLHQRVVDDAAGLPDGYCGKLEVGTKNLGVESCNALLELLGLEIVLVERATSTLPGNAEISREEIENLKRKRVRRARLAAYARSDKLSAKRRSDSARKAGKASALARRKRALIEKATRNRKAAAEARATARVYQKND